MSGYAYAAMAGLQLVSGYFAAENVTKTADINRQIADMNAEFAELDAYNAELEGYSQSAQYQKVIDDVLATQTAELAAADVDLSYGSVASIRSETEFIGQVNKMEIVKRAQEGSLGYERQAEDIRSQSILGYGRSQSEAASIRYGAVTGALKTGVEYYRSKQG